MAISFLDVDPGRGKRSESAVGDARDHDANMAIREVSAGVASSCRSGSIEM
jgi:hypothetical protein